MVKATGRVCLVSGGTGGHLMPALVLARSMQEAGHEPLLVTEGRDVERELVRRELPDVTSVEVPRSGSSPGSLPVWLIRATMAARRHLREHQIRGVISTGGRASVPVALAARSLRIPLFLLEQNAVTGRANRWLLPLAKRMYVGLPGAGERHARGKFTGTPLRSGFGRVDKGDARRSLGLQADEPVVLITGGSQGARVLNEVVPAALQRVQSKMQVMHLSGLGNDASVRHRYADVARDNVAHVRAVAADMDRLFAAADLVICRGGGTTIAELMAVGRAAIIIPYPHHKDRQQWHNARVLESVGAAIIQEEQGLNQVALTQLVEGLLSEPSRLRAMADNGRKLRRLDAADAILQDVQHVLGGEQPKAGPKPNTSRQASGERGAAARRGGVA
ncbi:MAG: UDP-N-acetylglucosamine--N-acetylmuramyl-(pentapeptide) pyrophosphoryl-undecaprenol N-acetylglucosamine transferase [Planctomycetota bacterium]